jgi:hypothetical protein
MPGERPGRRFKAIATKKVIHNHPAVELGFAGIGAKSMQPAPAVPSIANAAKAQEIEVEEEFIIMLDGAHEIDHTLLPEGAEVGDPVWINPADNKLILTDEAGEVHPAVSLTITATGGTYTLDADDEVTAALAFGLTAAQLRAALEALPNINAGDITVTGGPGDAGGTKPYIITFVDGPYADDPAPVITAAGAELTGGAKTAVIANATVGVKGTTAVKFALVEEIDTTSGITTLNLSQRSSF